jgi:carbon storage regulator
MLIVTRRFREELKIGNTVKVVVLRLSGDKLHIGVEAPDNLAVYGNEIKQRTNRERRDDGSP